MKIRTGETAVVSQKRGARWFGWFLAGSDRLSRGSAGPDHQTVSRVPECVRSRTAIHEWVQKADLQPATTAAKVNR